MNKIQIIITFALLAFQVPAAVAQWDVRNYPGSSFDGPAFIFEEVAVDIYQARGAGNLMVGSNVAIIVNDDDVVVIDSGISPVAAAALAEELKTITDKPIKTVINTHFHFDHAHGNQIYPADVQIIGHEFTYQMLVSGESIGRTYGRFSDWMASTPGGAEGQEGLMPTPPNTTLSDKLTLYRGGREIRLLFFGRGHTGGDVVVHLPAERVLLTGDLLLESIPFMGDGFPTDWIETLEKLKALEFDTVVPGHGQPFSDRERIGRLQSVLADLWEKTGEFCTKSLSAEQAAEQIDLTGHTTAYPEITGPGAPIATVERIYELRGCEP